MIWDNGPAHRGEAIRSYLATPNLHLRLVALPAYSPDFNADEAVWDWAREEVTANECLGTKAQVQEKMNAFFDGLTHRNDEVRHRCRTLLQARADALMFTPAVPLPSLPNVVPTLALVWDEDEGDEEDEGSGDYAGHAEQSLADVDGHLIPSGAAPDAFETILPQGVPARLWHRRLWRRGDATEGILVFSSGLMVVLHLWPSTGGFCCPLPEGIGSPGAGLSQTKPVGKSSESRFKAVSTSGVSPLVLRVS